MFSLTKDGVSTSQTTHARHAISPSPLSPSSRSFETVSFPACQFSPDDSSEDEDLQEVLEGSHSFRPFAGFGSYRQRRGGFPCSTRARRRSCLSREAPAKLESLVGGFLQTDERKTHLSSLKADSLASLDARMSFSTDVDREEAWERKRDLYLLENEITDVTEETRMRAVGRSSSDRGNETWPRPSSKSLARSRARSLTDEDLEELRGSIDLGFGFRYDESCDLRRTLPALELYYAINRQFDCKSCSSPASPLDGAASHQTSSTDSSSSPSNETWRVASPGDHPSQVKTRLRHWAKAVACAVKQGF